MTRWFTADDREDVADFWLVYEAAFDEIDEGFVRSADTVAAVRAAFAGDWPAYEARLRDDAKGCVTRGLGIASWSETIHAARDVVARRLFIAYGGSLPRLERTLRVLHRFFDSMMAVFAEEYLALKEQDLVQSEARNTAVLTASLDAVLTVDAQLNLLDINPAGERLFATHRAAVIGRSMKSFLDVGDKPARSRHDELVELHLPGGKFPMEVAVVSIGGGRFAAFIRDVTERERALRTLEASRGQLRALAGRMQDAREEENRRISREVHDVVGQALTAIKIDLTWLAARIIDANQSEVCAGMFALLDETLQSVRRIATELRPQVLDDLGLVAALEWNAAELRRRTDIHVTLDVPHEDVTMSDPVATTLYRIFQEAVSNVIRHASSERLDVRFAVEADSFLLTVRDHGRGIAPEQVEYQGALGLTGMRERAMLLGGVVDISPAVGGGTLVTARVPSRGAHEVSARHPASPP